MRPPTLTSSLTRINIYIYYLQTALQTALQSVFTGALVAQLENAQTTQTVITILIIVFID